MEHAERFSLSCFGGASQDKNPQQAWHADKPLIHHRRKAMKLYRLNIAPEESETEGEDCDEWFGSLEAAKTRRGALICANPTLDNCRFTRDYEIELVEFAELPPKTLLLAVLNRSGCFERVTLVVPPYERPGSDTSADNCN